MAVQDKVLAMLKSKEWVGADELEAAFPPKIKGHRSWGQRLRDLRLLKYGGYDIIYRTKKGTNHLTEWHIRKPEEATIPLISPNKGQGEAIATPQGAKDAEINQEAENAENRQSAPAFFERGKQTVFI